MVYQTQLWFPASYNCRIRLGKVSHNHGTQKTMVYHEIGKHLLYFFLPLSWSATPTEILLSVRYVLYWWGSINVTFINREAGEIMSGSVCPSVPPFTITSPRSLYVCALVADHAFNLSIGFDIVSALLRGQPLMIGGGASGRGFREGKKSFATPPTDH